MHEKLKSLLSNDRAFTAILVVLVAVGAFALGRLSATELGVGTGRGGAVAMTYTAPSPAERLEEAVGSATATADTVTAPTMGSTEVAVVASKSGTKYHLPDCPGAKQIKPENLISFASRAAAEAAGYTPAANCKGL